MKEVIEATLAQGLPQYQGGEVERLLVEAGQRAGVLHVYSIAAASPCSYP